MDQSLDFATKSVKDDNAAAQSPSLDDSSQDVAGSPLLLDDLQAAAPVQSQHIQSVIHHFDAQHTAESVVDVLETDDDASLLAASVGDFGAHVNQAKSIIQDLRERLHYSKLQADHVSREQPGSTDASAEHRRSIDPEEEGLATLLLDQQLLESKLQAAKTARGDDEFELKHALSSALEASRMQNRDLRENLANLNQALTAEIARRTRAEKELTETLRAMEVMKLERASTASEDQRILLEKLQKAEDECISLRAQLDAKFLSGSVQTPLDPILQIRAEISQLQEKRAAELTSQVKQLEEETEMLETLVTDLRVQLLDAQTERDLSKSEVNRLLKEQESREELIATLSQQHHALEPVSPPRRKSSFRESSEVMTQPAVTPHMALGGPTGERIIASALDQRDEAVQRLRETEADLRRVRQTMVELEEAFQAQQDDFEVQRGKLVATQQKHENRMMRGWTSATQQMMKKMSQLEQDLSAAQEQRDTRPSILQEALAANPENTVVRTMNVLVTKDKERDTFVETTLKFQEFMEKIIQMEATGTGNMELGDLVNDAKALLQATNAVMDLHSLPEGWEARMTKEGLTYYIDHVNKRSTWIHPKLGNDYLGSPAEHDTESTLTDDAQSMSTANNAPPTKKASLFKRFKKRLTSGKTSQINKAKKEASHRESFFPLA